MTKDNIINMARDAGFAIEALGSCPSLERFALLVAAFEREECAKAAMDVPFEEGMGSDDCKATAWTCASRIRMRSN